MAKLDNIVVGAVALAGGTLCGRIRLQKILYLLEQKGLNSGAKFTYYHYGPYSEQVTDSIADAKFWDQLSEQTEFRSADGAPYSVFTTNLAPPLKLGNLDGVAARSMLDRLKSEDSTVLELAARAHWLVAKEKISDWRAEIEKRKAGKTGCSNLNRALNLLRELNLSPA